MLVDAPPGVTDGGAATPVASAPIASPETAPDDAPRARAPQGPGAGLLVGCLAGMFGLLVGMRRIFDNSFLTHLATGRLILDEGGIPRADPYSFTAPGEPWVVQSWLASVLYAAAEDLGGFGAIRLLNGLLCAAIGVLVWLLTSRSPSLLVRTAVTGAVLVVGTEAFSGRPLLFGVIGVALVLLVADGRLDPRWLVPTGWVWVNTHGSFPFAVLLLGVLAVGTRLDRGRWGREPRALGWAVAGIVLGAVNPLGPRLLLFPAQLLRRTEAFATIREWKPPAFDVWHHYVVAALLLGTFVALTRRPSWRDSIVLAVFGALAMTSARNQVVLLIVLVPVLAGALPPVGPAVERLRRPVLRPALAMVPVLSVVFVVASLSTPHTNLSVYPEEAVAWMEEQGMWDPGSRVIAPDYVGNLRHARAGRDANVFIDDRVDMYPLEVVLDFEELSSGGPGWPEVLERHGATAVLWDATTPFGGALVRDEGWEVVHRSTPWVVAVPTSAR